MKYIYRYLTIVAFFSAYAGPTCNDPLTVSKSTIFELTDDIVITEIGSPFIAARTFGKGGPAKLTINSTAGKSIIIASDAAWDLSSFNNVHKIIEFTGNAQLICKQGSKIIGHGGKIRFAENSRWVMD